MWRRWEFLTAVSLGRQSPLPGAISEIKDKGARGEKTTESGFTLRKKRKIFQKVQRINLTQGKRGMAGGRRGRVEWEKKKKPSLSE